MTIKEIIENNAPIVFLGAIVTGFIAGWGTYQTYLKVNNYENLRPSEYITTKERDEKYTLKSEVKEQISVLKSENEEIRKNTVSKDIYDSLLQQMKNSKLSSFELKLLAKGKAEFQGFYYPTNPEIDFVVHFYRDPNRSDRTHSFQALSFDKNKEYGQDTTTRGTVTVIKTPKGYFVLLAQKFEKESFFEFAIFKPEIITGGRPL